FDAELQRRAVKSANGEHLPGHLEHRVLRAEREVLERPNLRETASPQLRRVHASNRRTSGQGSPTRVRPDVVCVLSEEQRPTRPRHIDPRGSQSEYRLRSEEHTSELQSHLNLVCRLLLEKKKERTVSEPESMTQVKTVC